MSGIFPNTGAVDPTLANNAQSGLDSSCTPGFYPRNCSAPVDGDALNAVISEIANLKNAMGEQYDCTSLTNLADAFKPATLPWSL